MSIFSQAIIVFGDNEPKCSKCSDRKARIVLSPRKNGLDSLCKKVRVFKVALD